MHCLSQQKKAFFSPAISCFRFDLSSVFGRPLHDKIPRCASPAGAPPEKRGGRSRGGRLRRRRRCRRPGSSGETLEEIFDSLSIPTPWRMCTIRELGKTTGNEERRRSRSLLPPLVKMKQPSIIRGVRRLACGSGMRPHEVLEQEEEILARPSAPEALECRHDARGRQGQGHDRGGKLDSFLPFFSLSLLLSKKKKKNPMRFPFRFLLFRKCSLCWIRRGAEKIIRSRALSSYLFLFSRTPSAEASRATATAVATAATAPSAAPAQTCSQLW